MPIFPYILTRTCKATGDYRHCQPLAKEQNSAGLEVWDEVPGGSICEADTGADASSEAGLRRRLKMTWSEEYQSKRMSAAQALEAVRSGDRVWIQSGCGTPSALVDALVARAPELRDVEIVHMKTLGGADYTQPEYEGHFRHRGLVPGRQCARGGVRRARRLHAHLPQRD